MACDCHYLDKHIIYNLAKYSASRVQTKTAHNAGQLTSSQIKLQLIDSGATHLK